MRWTKLHENARMPTQANDTDAGFDLRCLEDFSLVPGQTKIVPTGVGIDWVEDYRLTVWKTVPYGVISPRSGLAAKHSITVVNSPGLIDYGYTGELQVILHMLKVVDNNSLYSDPAVYFSAGDRIAQIRFGMAYINLRETWGEVRETDRGAKGFGSSGVA